MIPESAVAFLLAGNVVTLALLALALRANWRWRRAFSELGERARRDIRDSAGAK